MSSTRQAHTAYLSHFLKTSGGDQRSRDQNTSKDRIATNTATTCLCNTIIVPGLNYDHRPPVTLSDGVPVNNGRKVHHNSFLSSCRDGRSRKLRVKVTQEAWTNDAVHRSDTSGVAEKGRAHGGPGPGATGTDGEGTTQDDRETTRPLRRMGYSSGTSPPSLQWDKDPVSCT